MSQYLETIDRLRVDSITGSAAMQHSECLQLESVGGPAVLTFEEVDHLRSVLSRWMANHEWSHKREDWEDC